MSTFCILKYFIVLNHISEIGGSPFLTYENGIYGQITSPGYPGNYPNNANYTWIIRTGHQKANVTVKIAMMNIEKWKCDDYLLIREIDPCCFTAFKRCGVVEGMTVYVRGNEIQVSFISDHGKTAKGFNLTWTVTLPATTTLPKTSIITAQKVDLTSSTPITTTTRRNVLTTKLFYTSSTNPIRSTAPRENIKSTTLLHKSTPKKPSSSTTRIENLKTTTLLHTSKSTNPIRTTAQKGNLNSTRLLHKSTPTKSSSTTALIDYLKTTTLLHTSTSTKPIRTTPQKENLKSTTPVYELKQSRTSIHATDLYGVSTSPHKAQSVTTTTETTATNESEVYLIGGVGAFVLVVSIIVICVAGRGQKNNKKIQKRHQKDTDKRETLASMHVYSSPMYETIPEDMISPDEATGDYALVNDKEFTWYAAKNVSESEHMTRVDSFSNVTDVYHTLEPNTRFTEPSPLLQRISNVYHTLEMTSFLQPEYDLDQ
uniref:Uncharacterized protein LOC111123356 isoform X2 n=1 Tax=Crassostrea virginica TaxID=6565 RepID=A0A8B8CZM9_CRAVI|nr:uncharacterized protein LOC111123356 isoform X2 [Crassostrea virginica]